MRILASLLLLSASAILGQTTPILVPNYFPPQLKAYLGISDDQVERMNAVRGQIAQLQMPKVQRQAQLQLEIAEETAKTLPSATVLGPRYAELELIRRDLEMMQKALVSQTQLILGSDQKNKLVTLQQALNLYATACSAVSVSLLSPPPFAAFTAPQISNSALGAIASFLLPTAQQGCAAPTLAFRIGDFSPTLGQ